MVSAVVEKSFHETFVTGTQCKVIDKTSGIAQVVFKQDADQQFFVTVNGRAIVDCSSSYRSYASIHYTNSSQFTFTPVENNLIEIEEIDGDAKTVSYVDRVTLFQNYTLQWEDQRRSNLGEADNSNSIVRKYKIANVVVFDRTNKTVKLIYEASISKRQNASYFSLSLNDYCVKIISPIHPDDLCGSFIINPSNMHMNSYRSATVFEIIMDDKVGYIDTNSVAVSHPIYNIKPQEITLEQAKQKCSSLRTENSDLQIIAAAYNRHGVIVLGLTHEGKVGNLFWADPSMERVSRVATVDTFEMSKTGMFYISSANPTINFYVDFGSRLILNMHPAHTFLI